MTASAKTPIRLILVGLLLMVAMFATGIVFGRFVLPPTVGVYNAAPPPKTSNQANFGVFWEAWNLIHTEYADKSAINDQKLTYGAISGMVDAVGDTGHTRFLTPDDLKHFNNDLNGSFVGIGVRVQQNDKNLVVTAPLPNSPAEKAGILAGDIIISVNGTDVTGMQEDAVVALIVGKEGTQVTIGIQRGSELKPRSFTITRATIETDSVQYTYVPDTKTGLIRILNFDKNTADHFRAAVNDLRAKGMARLILDLRNDPGGLLDQSISVADEFLDKGTILLTQDGSGKRTPTDAKPGGVITDEPVVVLVNNGTASAAEILTAALEENGRAQAVIGERTFGTGTVLTTHILSDGSALLLGTQEWLTPKGEFIRNNGVTPTIPVTEPANALPITIADDHAPIPAATIQSGTDAQLQKALQTVTGQ